MGNKKTRFTKEFKEGAMKLVTLEGYTQQEAADRLGVSCKNISRWLGESRGKVTIKKLALTDEQKELERLRKENKRLKLEREILKKAAAFFANESN